MNKKRLGAVVAAMCLLTLSPAAVQAASKSSTAGGTLTNLPLTPNLTNSATSQFQFIVGGDCRPANAGDPPALQLAYLVSAAQTLHPAFIFSAGDTIFGHNSESKNIILGEYNAFLQRMEKAAVPIFNCPGNHELCDENDKPNTTQQGWYSKNYSPLYGSFVYGNSTFIALDTSEIPPPGTPPAPEGEPGNLSPGYVSAKQMAWLKTTLDQSVNQDNVFIFMHHPIYCSDQSLQLRKSCASQIVNLVQNYPNVAYIIAAHLHGYYNPQNPKDYTTPSQRTNGGPPLYVVSGGAGAVLETGPGGFNHYLVFSVNGKTVNVQLVRED